MNHNGNNGNVGPTPIIKSNYNGTNTALTNVQYKDKQEQQVKADLEKCKKRDKGKKPYPAGDGKTIFYCSNSDQAKKRIALYNKSLIAKS